MRRALGPGRAVMILGPGTAGAWFRILCFRLPDFETDTLGQRERIAVVDRVGSPAHVDLPDVGARLAAASGFLLTAECASDLRAGRANVDVGDAAVRAFGGQKSLSLLQI